MQDLFLGLDTEDLFFHNQLRNLQTFILEPRPAHHHEEIITTWSDCLQAIGQVSEIDMKRSIYNHGERFSLPIKPWLLPRLVPDGALKNTGKQWLEAKTRSISSVIMGGGREERSYFDWVSRRMGEEVYRHIYSAYIYKRFGSSGAELSAGLARVLHFGSSGKKQIVYGAPKNSEQVTWGCTFERFSIERNRITSVVINSEQHNVEGRLYIALPVTRILALLPNVPKSIEVDAHHLRYQDQGMFLVEGENERAAAIHYLDKDHPWIVRYCLPSGDSLIWFDPEQEREAQEELERVGLTIKSRWIRSSWVPVWGKQSHFRYRRVAAFLESLGITLVGKRALYSQKSMPETIVLRLQHRDLEISEFLRLHIDPPVRQEDLNASLLEWIVD